ncbi:MAG: helix-turn-helix transcriptional regulator [Saprospiraceae bacterium]|nr:helix-turn-helix transcriptional regulator [Saprospiraceae bacterium]
MVEHIIPARFFRLSTCVFCFWVILMISPLNGQQSINATDTVGSYLHGYDQIARLKEHYKREKANGRSEQALKHLENAYQELDKIHDSLLRANSSSRISDWAVRENKMGLGEKRNWSKWLICGGLFVLLVWLCMWIYYQIQLGRLRASIRHYIQKEADQMPIVQDALAPNISLADGDAAAPGDWINMVKNYAVANLHDPMFSLESWSTEMALSPRQFQRKLKAATGQTVTEFLQELKLQQAKIYLDIGKFQQLKDLAAAVGMRDVKYFSKVFKTRFGESPTNYGKK